ncbi:hypothetical protein BH09ACT5_BH09ACT5_15180 [soil metagenome]
MPSHAEPVRWFRIAYAQNALLRSLDVPLQLLSPGDAVRAVLSFQAGYRPQHADLDALACSWGPEDGLFAFSLERRMHRHGHREAVLALRLAFVLTPARTALQGRSNVASSRDATATAGYRAIARAAVVERTLTLRGGGPLSS